MSNNETETTLFDSMSVEELQVTVDELAEQLRDAKIALRYKSLSGVRSAVEARRDADAELSEELRKIGYSAKSRSLFLHDPYLPVRLVKF